MLQVGEPTELYFSLYNEIDKKFITENFVVCLSAQGLPEKIELLNKLFTLFKVSFFVLYLFSFIFFYLVIIIIYLNVNFVSKKILLKNSRI